MNENIEDDEIRIFIKWFFICIPGQHFLLQVFQLLGNYEIDFHHSRYNFENIFYVLGFITGKIFSLLILYLVVVKNGAKIIAKYIREYKIPVLGITITENLVKGIIVLSFLAGIASRIVQI